MTDRDLVRLYWPAVLRPAFDALFAIDDALADVVTSSTQPALGAIRLAWWREALERLDTNPPPSEPRLQAAAAELLSRGVTGAMLAELEDGWATLLDEQPDVGRIGKRGAKLFAIAAILLGAEDGRLDAAGRLYAYELVKRRQLAPVHYPTDELHSLAGHRFRRRLRPLTALARLAARDVKQAPAIEPEATPGRAAALLSHRLFGTVV
ncbi:MAG TPA: squalene/phytoene synthase family protein [Sphingomicrobium sp.]